MEQTNPIILRLVVDSRNNICLCIQNSWLGLPEGMSSNTSEFQQALRYHLGALLTKLLALIFICPLTGLSLKAVWREREAMEAEVRDKQVGNVFGSVRGSRNAISVRSYYTARTHTTVH